MIESPVVEGLDWASIPILFGHCMADGASQRVWNEMRTRGVGSQFDLKKLERLMLPEVLAEGEGGIEEVNDVCGLLEQRRE